MRMALSDNNSGGSLSKIILGLLNNAQYMLFFVSAVALLWSIIAWIDIIE
jgi:hypothetical protein